MKIKTKNLQVNLHGKIYLVNHLSDFYIFKIILQIYVHILLTNISWITGASVCFLISNNNEIISYWLELCYIQKSPSCNLTNFTYILESGIREPPKSYINFNFLFRRFRVNIALGRYVLLINLTAFQLSNLMLLK